MLMSPITIRSLLEGSFWPTSKRHSTTIFYLRVAEIEGDMLKAFVAKDPAKLMLKYQLWVTAKAELAERERAVAGAHAVAVQEWSCQHSRAQLGARQGAHGERLTRNSLSETIAPHNRSLVIDGHADDQSSSC